MMADHDTLCALIPHGGTMCLLDRVDTWDEQRIVCTTSSHRSTDNPLRSKGKLAVVNALEYGAQAMAVHGGLSAYTQGERIKSGYVVAVRDARFHIDRLDLLEEPLTLEAIQLISSGANQIYRIKVSAAGQPVAEAQITVMNSIETDT